jgi:hypothetical protein
MDQLLQEITMLPGVLGCFVFNAKQGVLGSKMPPIFKENNLQTVGSLLTRTVQIGDMAMLVVKEIEMQYNESLLIIKLLPREAMLIIICEPNANKSLINMTIGMLAKDIAEVLSLSVVSQTVSPEPQQQKPQKSPAQAQATQQQKTETDGELTSILKQVKDALAMVIGPIAGPVLKDSVKIWAKQTPPTTSSLPDLAKLLCTEINEKGLEERFRKELKKIF